MLLKRAEVHYRVPGKKNANDQIQSFSVLFRIVFCQGMCSHDQSMEIKIIIIYIYIAQVS